MGKKILIFILAASCTILILGCSKNKEAKSNSMITLRLGMGASSPEETKLINKQIAMFEKENPKIKVVKQIAVGDFNEWLQMNVAAGTAPDVSYVDVYLAKDYINYNAFLSLNKYFTKQELKNFYPSLLDGFTVDGKVYGIPKDFNTVVMFYNKDMFKTAGIKSVPKNWDELETALQKLQAAGKVGKLGENFKYPMSFVMEWNRIAPFVLQNGGYTYKNGKLDVASKKATSAVDFVFSLMKKGYLADPKQMGGRSDGAAFGEGQTAIIYSGGWQVPYLKQAAPNLNYGIAELPGNIKDGTTIFTIAYCILAKTKHPEAAEKLLKFLTGKQAEELTAKSGMAVPSRIDCANYFTKYHPAMGALASSAKFGVVFNWGKNSNTKNKELNDAGKTLYIDYTVGDKSMKAETVLKPLQKKLEFSDM